MAKRKLSNKQKRNLNKLEQDRIKRALKTDQKIEDELSAGNLGPEQQGLLVAHHGVHLIVEDANRELHQCKSRSNLSGLATGDKVIWRSFADKTGVIVAKMPRSHTLARPSGRQIRPMAANVDQMVVVIAPEPMPSATTLDRYLVISELIKLPCIIVVNKRDLLEQNDHPEFKALLQTYAQLDYPLVQVSHKLANGLEPLTRLLRDKLSVFVGQSGVGKSSLISHLVPHAQIQVGKLSEQTLLGRHTTSCARLYHLPGGGDLIDSPGIRRFGLWHLSRSQLIQGFKEFAPYLGQCKFRNCEHQHEPGCALRDAVEQGEIHPQRLDNYHALLQSHDLMQTKHNKQ